MFPNRFLLSGLVILNKSGKRKLTVFLTDIEHVLKRSAVNSYHTVRFDKCGKNKHDPTSKKTVNCTGINTRGSAEFIKWTVLATN